MARKTGDGNYSLREKRLAHEKTALELENKALQAKLKAKDARIRELGGRIGSKEK